MHGLVQVATQKWLEAYKQQEKWRHQFIKNLNVQLPTGNYENWMRCQTLFPHAQSAVAQQPEEPESLRDWASILYKAAWYACEMGKGVEAEKMFVQVMKIRNKILGQEHSETLDSMSMAPIAYKLRGRWGAAEELELQVLETSRKNLGADHPYTLGSMNNLAFTLKATGGDTEAIRLMEECINLSQRVLRLDHLRTLSLYKALVKWMFWFEFKRLWSRWID